jgi:hypothetical protein
MIDYNELEIDHNTKNNTLDIDVTVDDRSTSASFTLKIPDVIKLRDYLNTINFGEQL